MELPPGAIGLLPIAAVVFVYFAYRFYRKWRDRRIREKPFTESMNDSLVAALPFFPGLRQAEQQRLREKINRFLAHKRFYGCAGLSITEEIRVTIAAEACLLILNHEGEVYPGLTSILVYPSAFVVNHSEADEDGIVSFASRDLLGESWDNGRVILAWDAVAHGTADFADGNNVVLHEFAHQLDALSGLANGAPPLSGHSYRSWARVLSQHFTELQYRSERGLPTIMDTYGATNPAEFFAVATETFYEKPDELYNAWPGLFEELRAYYRLDPREWRRSRGWEDRLQ
jgi:Mlc titration factor MtfA (ptsG expression regulator)